MKTSITNTLRLVVGAALLFGVSAIQAITYTAGVVYEGNFNDTYLNGSPLLAKFEVSDLVEGFGGEFKPGIAGDSYMDAFTVEATTPEGIAGTWSFDPSKVTTSPVLYPTKMLIKADGGWYFLEIGLGETSGTWSTEPIAVLMPHGNVPELSHISFYDTAVPIPAAAYLFGSALVGLAGIGYRLKR